MKKNGFSLIELIIVVGLFSLVFSLLLGIWQNSFSYWTQINNQIELQQNLRLSIDSIVVDLRKAKFIDDIGDNYIIFTDIENNIIKFELEDDPHMKEHLYQINGKTLYRTQNFGNKQPIANFINEMNFNPDTLELDKVSYIEILVSGFLKEKNLQVKAGVEIKWTSHL